MKDMLLIPRIKIQNANALSSPYTIGFPAMTAWLGVTHALERKLVGTDFEDIKFTSMAVVCHKLDLQTHRGDGDFDFSIIGTGNPLVEKTKRKKGEPWDLFARPSFIEEARCHLTVSLVIECEDIGLIDINEFEEFIDRLTPRMKFASGDFMGSAPSKLINVDGDTETRKFLRQLMPGYCLIERRDLMIRDMEKGNDAIDSLLNYLKVTHHCDVTDNNKVEWTGNRKVKGWIVPIATGFHGITDLGYAVNQRDPTTPHRFAESIITLGEFKMPYRISHLDNMLWHYHTDVENNLYLCRQNKSTKTQL